MPPDLPRENLWKNIETSELLSTLGKTGAGNTPADSPRLSSSLSLPSESPLAALCPSTRTAPHAGGPQRARVGFPKAHGPRAEPSPRLTRPRVATSALRGATPSRPSPSGPHRPPAPPEWSWSGFTPLNLGTDSTLFLLQHARCQHQPLKVAVLC